MEILEQDRYECLVITKRDVQFKDIIKKCLPCFSSTRVTTSFRFKAYPKNEKLVHFFEFLGKTGVPKLVQKVFIDFEGILKKKLKVTGQSEIKRLIAPSFYSKNSVTQSEQSVILTTERCMMNNNESFMMHTHQDMLEVNKIVQVNRLLASNKYSVGKKVLGFQKSFVQMLENEDPDLQEMMTKLSAFCKEIHNNLISVGNLGGERMKGWLNTGKFVVEKYIFESVFKEFFEALKKRNVDKDKLFSERSEFLRTKTSSQLLDNLKVKNKFRKNSVETDDTLYSDAILELKKLDLCMTPKDKLDCVIMMNSRMRAFVIKCHHGELEIQSMDEELPLTMYILAQSTSHSMYSNLDYIEMYVKSQEIIENEDLDNEIKIITNLSASADFISKFWKIEEIE